MARTTTATGNPRGRCSSATDICSKSLACHMITRDLRLDKVAPPIEPGCVERWLALAVKTTLYIVPTQTLTPDVNDVFRSIGGIFLVPVRD